MFLCPGLGILLMQGMAHGSGVLALLSGLAGAACIGWGGWLGILYAPLVWGRGRNRNP